MPLESVHRMDAAVISVVTQTRGCWELWYFHKVETTAIRCAQESVSCMDNKETAEGLRQGVYAS